MLRLNRATEYGLISLLYLHEKGEGGVATAREISEARRLPFEKTAKILQKLKSSQILSSIQGVQGGYVLSQPLAGINLGEFLRVMEGDKGIVKCLAAKGDELHDSCDHQFRCNIQPFLAGVNSRVSELLLGVSLDQLVRK